jgi:hypothetical protein
MFCMFRKKNLIFNLFSHFVSQAHLNPIPLSVERKYRPVEYIWAIKRSNKKKYKLRIVEPYDKNQAVEHCRPFFVLDSAY